MINLAGYAFDRYMKQWADMLNKREFGQLEPDEKVFYRAAYDEAVRRDNIKASLQKSLQP